MTLLDKLLKRHAVVELPDALKLFKILNVDLSNTNLPYLREAAGLTSDLYHDHQFHNLHFENLEIKVGASTTDLNNAYTPVRITGYYVHSAKHAPLNPEGIPISSRHRISLEGRF